MLLHLYSTTHGIELLTFGNAVYQVLLLQCVMLPTHCVPFCIIERQLYVLKAKVSIATP